MNLNFLTTGFPYWEILLPLLVGVTAGFLCIVMGRVLFGRKTGMVAPPVEKRPDYDPFVHGSPTEHRKALRRGGNPTEVFVALPEDKENSIRGWVLDRSVGGMGLLLDEEVAPGTKLCVLPVNAPTMTPWVEIEVRSSRHVKDGWETGCQFIRTPPWSVLLLFG